MDLLSNVAGRINEHTAVAITEAWRDVSDSYASVINNRSKRNDLTPTSVTATVGRWH